MQITKVHERGNTDVTVRHTLSMLRARALVYNLLTLILKASEIMKLFNYCLFIILVLELTMVIVKYKCFFWQNLEEEPDLN